MVPSYGWNRMLMVYDEHTWTFYLAKLLYRLASFIEIF